MYTRGNCNVKRSVTAQLQAMHVYVDVHARMKYVPKSDSMLAAEIRGNAAQR